MVLVLILANKKFCGKLVGRFSHSGPLLRYAISAPITALHFTATKPQHQAIQTKITTCAMTLIRPATIPLRIPHAVVAPMFYPIDNYSSIFKCTNYVDGVKQVDYEITFCP